MELEPAYPLDILEDFEHLGILPPIDEEDDPALECLNCDHVDCWPPQKLYCSARCHDIAHYVRYSRAVRRDERISRPDVQEALEIKLATIFSGGYPAKERQLTADVRDAVFERDSWHCVSCGADATEIDHIDCGSDDPANLRALCAQCHRRKTINDFTPITFEDEPEQWLELTALNHQLEKRIAAEQPLRECDDDRNWSNRWHEITKERYQFARNYWPDIPWSDSW